MVEIEFQLLAGGPWYRTTVTPSNYASIMRSGHLDSMKLLAVRLWYTDVEDEQGNESREYLVYDFQLRTFAACV